MNVEEILARLIAFPSVVGTPNEAIVNWVRGYCQAAGAEVAIIPGPEGISRAHRADEYIEIGELAACQRMIEDLGARLAA
jgi:acetylornithine deacetylase/succinyl-diaminopimelate desuccinylase-like protein